MLNKATLCALYGLGVPVLAAIPGGSLILSLLGISFLIFVHEWGHYIACVLTKTRTETFSIGFGPRLFGWERAKSGERRFTWGQRQLDPADHSMDFRVAAVPLGGYVKMAGELPGEGTPGAADEFPGKPAWARTFIVSAGVIMNMITALVFYFIAFQGGKADVLPVVGSVVPGGPAWEAGLEPGDVIRRMDGSTVRTWTDVRMETAFFSRDTVADVQVERDGAMRDLQVTPRYSEEEGVLKLSMGAAYQLVIGSGDDALTVGLSDRVTVNGVPTRGGAAVHRRIQEAVSVGLSAVEIDNGQGGRATLALGSRPPEGSADDAPQKIGLVQYGPWTVEAVRADETSGIAVGDVVLAARSGTERHELDSGGAQAVLVFLPRVDALIVRRAGEEMVLPVALDSPAAIVAFLDRVALAQPDSRRVKPLAEGHLYTDGLNLYRYPASPAQAAGLVTGDEVLKINGTKITSFLDMVVRIGSLPAGKPMTLTVIGADGAERDLEVTPVRLTPLGALPLETIQESVLELDGVGEAFSVALQKTGREVVNVFRTIGALFSGSISFNKNIAGPITIVTVSQRFAERSWLQLVWFMAYISVMLAVLNILPIPVLDGGHLMFILIEKIKGSPLKESTMIRMQQVGLLMLLVLMVFAFKNDFVRLFSS